MKLVGKLVKVDLGGGGWALETSDGRRFELAGKVPADLEGEEVRVEGRTVEAAGFLMTGDPTLDVKRVEKA